MKRFMPMVALIALATPASAIEVTTQAGQLSSLIDDYTVTSLTISGEMDARDFHFIAGSLDSLKVLDLHDVQIVAYSDAHHPLTAAVYDFEAGTLPQSMLMGMRLENIILPDSLRAIGQAALAGCDRLSTVVIPSTVTHIGDYAFSGSGLTSIVIPATVAEIGKGAFAHCYGLQTATVQCSRVGDYAFVGNTNLQSLVLGEQVRHIGVEAFHGSALATLDASAATALDSVGAWFAASTPMTSLSLPASLSTVGEGAFFGTTELMSASLPSSLHEVPAFAFAGGSQIVADTLLLHDGVTSIGDYAFYNWGQSRYFFIPGSVAHIGTRAMAGMTGLEQIDIDALQVPTLGDSVWAGVNQPLVKLGTANNETASLYAAAEQWQDFYLLHDYLLGDVNGDGMVDVSDINLMVMHLLGGTPNPFIEQAADINGDQVIDVTDINGVLNIILGSAGQTTVRRIRGQQTDQREFTDDHLSMDALSVKAGESYTIDLRLVNSQSFSAMQFDITLPAGLELEGVGGGARSAAHNQVSKTRNATTRVVSFSLHGSDYVDSDDAVLRLTVRATDEVAEGATINITHVVLAQADGTGFLAADSSTPVSNTTGISNLTADSSQAYAAGSTLVIEATEAGSVQVVSLNGRVRTLTVPAGHSEWIDLEAGIYVIRLQGKSYKVAIQ